MLTQQRICEILDYDPATGNFTHLMSRGGVKAGDLAGGIQTQQDGRQYRQIRVGGKIFRAHRLAWFFVHGRWPVEHIDHIDGDGLNNRIDNLREATHSENLRNRGATTKNTSGFKGVSWHKARRKWQAQIKTNGRKKHLGSFDTPEAAYAAYCAAAEDLHGDFAMVQTRHR